MTSALHTPCRWSYAPRKASSELACAAQFMHEFSVLRSASTDSAVAART